MNKSLKIILSLIGLILVMQFVLIFILFNRDSTASATRSCPIQDVSTSERAKEVALDYISDGIAGDVTLVNEIGGRIYAVNISKENIHYVIYVHSDTGDVVWLTREEFENEGVKTIPEDLSPDDVLY